MIHFRCGPLQLVHDFLPKIWNTIGKHSRKYPSNTINVIIRNRIGDFINMDTTIKVVNDVYTRCI